MWYDAFCCLRCIHLIGRTFQFAALLDCSSDSLTFEAFLSCCLNSFRQVGGRHPGGSAGSKMNRGFPVRHFVLSILRM